MEQRQLYLHRCRPLYLPGADLRQSCCSPAAAPRPPRRSACPFRPLYSCGILSPQPQYISTSQRKCSSKKNSSTRRAISGLRSSSIAIGISTSGVSMASLNDTKSSGVAISQSILSGDKSLSSVPGETGALKKW